MFPLILCIIYYIFYIYITLNKFSSYIYILNKVCQINIKKILSFICFILHFPTNIRYCFLDFLMSFILYCCVLRICFYYILFSKCNFCTLNIIIIYNSFFSSKRTRTHYKVGKAVINAIQQISITMLGKLLTLSKSPKEIE